MVIRERFPNDLVDGDGQNAVTRFKAPIDWDQILLSLCGAWSLAGVLRFAAGHRVTAPHMLRSGAWGVYDRIQQVIALALILILIAQIRDRTWRFLLVLFAAHQAYRIAVTYGFVAQTSWPHVTFFSDLVALLICVAGVIARRSVPRDDGPVNTIEE